ncbi:MAG: hypothetical protein PUA58_06165 [Ruminococcus sp.]|nr:hypothetical protein [Ruminococcus sp.]
METNEKRFYDICFLSIRAGMPGSNDGTCAPHIQRNKRKIINMKCRAGRLFPAGGLNMFTVTKGKTIYTVKECAKHWTVSTTNGKLNINYQIDKELCNTREEIEKYIASEAAFIGGYNE